MGIKATTALTAMAAAAENRPSDNPSRDTSDAIDDALSVADEITFFGGSTKSVKGKGENSGSYCTIPVCYKFRDRETRVKAEQVLRNCCKISCATPYPQALRECMKKTLENGRRARPDDFCSVGFDMAKMSLKVSWRVKGTSEWIRHSCPIPIPTAVVESPNKVPDGGFALQGLPFVTITSPSHTAQRPEPGRDATNFHDTIDSSLLGVTNAS